MGGIIETEYKTQWRPKGGVWSTGALSANHHRGGGICREMLGVHSSTKFPSLEAY